MSWWRLLVATLVHFRGTNSVIVLGVAAATAVMTGALIVGDSVRGSLLALSDARLEDVDLALIGQQFFREDWAEAIEREPEFRKGFHACIPALVLRGSVETPGTESGTIAARAGKVQVYGVTTRWSELSRTSRDLPLAANEVAVSERVAKSLGLESGSEVLLTLELPTSIPKDSLLGEKEEPSRQIPLKVRLILPEEESFGRFGLVPDQQAPLSVFVNLATLQDRLDLSAEPASRRRAGRAGRVNALFVRAKLSGNSATRRSDLGQLVRKTWSLADLMLRITPRPEQGYLSLESDMMVLEDRVVEAGETAATALGQTTSPALIYLVNQASAGKGEAAYSMYSAICGLDPALMSPNVPGPLGGFRYVGKAPEKPLQPDEMLINSWLAEDLKAGVGDEIEVQYHISGSRGELPEILHRFRVAGVLSLDAGTANDEGLTPEVPGITDAASLADWDQPFPMKMSRITSRDDLYWDAYKSTPKMFIPLDQARELFRNRHGATTSLRSTLPAGVSVDQAVVRWSEAILKELSPADLGLEFRDLRAEGRKAAGGTTDFGGLFIGFSFFLIVSAAILVALLFRLALERRPAQIGLLLSIGASPGSVRRLLLAEATVLAVQGVILGLIAAAGYAGLMVWGLTTLWVGAIGTRFIEVYLHPGTLALGAALSLPVALISMLSGFRGLSQIGPRTLLAGTSELRESNAVRDRRIRVNLWQAVGLGIAAVLLAVAGILGLLPDREAFGGFSVRVVGFFASGFLGLWAGLCGFAVWLATPGGEAVAGRGVLASLRLGLRNASRQRLRSALTVGMIAVATFLIVAIAAGRKDPAAEAPELNSGNGGYLLVGETDVPVLFDLATAEGRTQLDLDDSASPALWSKVRAITPFRVNPGENASCLNIFQTKQPTILGVTSDQAKRGGFKFVGAGDNPWGLLSQADPDGIIPVFGDLNTLQYSLHVGPGAVIELRDGRDRPFKARIAGMLDASLFQGVLLMSEANFQAKFPDRAGFQYFLVDVAEADATQVSNWLESRVPGLDLDRVGDRLAGFLAVQNTYLSTFQALGGLGLLLGTLGLGTILLRNVLERRSEIALLKAVGFGPAQIAAMVLGENGLLLGSGLGLGTGAALLAMSPHLASVGADVSWGPLLGQLILVVVAGMVSATGALVVAWRMPIVATLRSQ